MGVALNVALEAMELRQGRSRRREVVNKSDEVDVRGSKRRLGSLIVLFLFSILQINTFRKNINESTGLQTNH
jgi:hypothetical protein